METQTASLSHNRRLEELETCEAPEKANNHLKAQHQPSNITSRLVSEQPFHHDYIKDRLAGCAEGAKLLYNGQNDTNIRQDYSIEIDDSLPDAPVGSVWKRRMEDDAAAGTPSARRKLRQHPPKANHTGFISWKEVSLEPNTAGPKHSALDRIKSRCHKDDQARWKELGRVRAQTRRMQAQLDDLRNKVGFLEE